MRDGHYVVESYVEAIGEEAFRRVFLKEITFMAGSKLRFIGPRAFEHSCLKSIHIPCTVEAVADDRFSECSMLETIIFEPPSSLKSLGKLPFMGTALNEIPVPEQCSKLTGLSLVGGTGRVAISPGNPFFISDDVAVTSSDGKRLVRFLGVEQEITISNQIQVIETGCFYRRRARLRARFGCPVRMAIAST
jgi:hypothetical protein